VQSNTTKAQTISVNVDNFIRAETDMYFKEVTKMGGFGKFHHSREVMPIDKQDVICANRDILYSSAVFDLEAGPVTITLPDPGKRFMSLMALNEDQYSPGAVYGAGSYTFTREKIGSCYLLLAVRTFIDPTNPTDIQQVHGLQDAIKVEQNGSGYFQIPNWDQVGQKKVRDALVALAAAVPDSRRMFGAKGEVDEVRRLVGTATGWGGNPEKDALYVTVVPSKNDGKTIHRLTVKDVPVDGFWSISVYNARGYFEKNQYDAYTLNNITAKKAEDGSVTIQFGGCDGKTPNCLPITPGWNYWVRLYRPRPEIMNGKWVFPEAHPVHAVRDPGLKKAVGSTD
jgi:hypothetical protein